ncbi:MAG: ethanolamine ammonia-lyase subunit EutC [Ruminococcaceae bacterium]|nr:ethanolamine ammonia-lyase subunit EutC [Oscillospiraceae bacterium]
MNTTQLKAMVADLLKEMNLGSQEPPVKSSDYHPTQPEPATDFSDTDLRQLYLVEKPMHPEEFLRLKKKTPARLGVGRAGARYKTATMLRFRADHAAAQDSVFSEVPEDFAKGNDLVPLKTLCTNKDEYLTRPDLGRRFDEHNQKVIRSVCGEHPKVVLVVGDGLSSAAIEANAMDCLSSIRQGLSHYGIAPAKALYVHYCRVGASDHIGTLTNADLVCMLVGERPGLVTAESMSCYLTYAPRIGVPESQRTVVSNIHSQGTPAVEAGAHIAELIAKMLEFRCSGIALKEKLHEG